MEGFQELCRSRVARPCTPNLLLDFPAFRPLGASFHGPSLDSSIDAAFSLLGTASEDLVYLSSVDRAQGGYDTVGVENHELLEGTLLGRREGHVPILPRLADGERASTTTEKPAPPSSPFASPKDTGARRLGLPSAATARRRPSSPARQSTKLEMPMSGSSRAVDPFANVFVPVSVVPEIERGASRQRIRPSCVRLAFLIGDLADIDPNQTLAEFL